MIRALLLDVDGVLVLGRPHDGLGWATDLEADLGLPADVLAREFFAPHWEEIVTGDADLTDRLARVLERVAPHLPASDLIDYWFAQDSRLDAGLLADIARCRRAGLQVHLATNQEHLRARHLMETMLLSDHVDGMFYSADLKCRKPDRRFFDLVRARIRMSPEELMLVDDTAANVESARTAGWNALLWRPGMSLGRALGVGYPTA